MIFEYDGRDAGNCFGNNVSFNLLAALCSNISKVNIWNSKSIMFHRSKLNEKCRNISLKRHFQINRSNHAENSFQTIISDGNGLHGIFC